VQGSDLQEERHRDTPYTEMGVMRDDLGTSPNIATDR
jgi:hypothetical protein